MDDRLFLGSIIYLFLAILVISLLPNDLFFGAVPEVATSTDLQNSLNVTGGASSNLGEPFDFFDKLITFLFTSWTVPGVPIYIGLIITLLNVITTYIAVVYIYDKIRGIGS